MTKAPTSLHGNIERLCQSIRHGEGDTPSCYREFIRSSIGAVISQSFPQFNAAISAEQRTDYIDGFLAEHPAQAPEYHHIATEFVRYMQTPLAGQPLMMLLEYEWVLLSVEISPEQVAAPVPRQTAGEIANGHVQINPTLIRIEVPFTLNTLPFVADTEKKRYAIFRNAAHEILSLRLNDRDMELLNVLSQRPVSPVAWLINETAQQFPRAVLLDWLETRIEDQILSITR